MRLFLSSYRAGNHEQKLVEIFGKSSKVAVITNAKDDKTSEEREESVTEILEFLVGLGFKAKELDLRKYFSAHNFSEEDLNGYKAVWVGGGNTFVLRRALKQSGADTILIKMVKMNELIYGGESAGAILPAPTLTGVQFGDDPNDVPSGYNAKILWDGLCLIKFHIVPHYQTEWDGAKDMINELKKHGLRYRTITDAQAIIIDGNKEEFLK